MNERRIQPQSGSEREAQVTAAIRQLRGAAAITAALTNQERADLLALVENARSAIVQCGEYRGVTLS